MNRILFLFLLFYSQLVFSQKEEAVRLFTQLKSCRNDSCRKETNEQLQLILEALLKADNQLKVDLSDMPNCGVLTSKDQKVRIITWNTPIDTGAYQYYGFLQVFNKKLGKYLVFKLQDKSSSIDRPERALLSPEKWLGCLYYKIIETRSGRNTLYTLLGVELGNTFTSSKFIEVLSLNPNGVPCFGGNYFQQYYKKQKLKAGNQDPGMPKASFPAGKRNLLKNRWIFEYKYSLQVKLTYNETEKAIYIPHLSPPNPSLIGQYQFYGPDLSVDAIKWRAGKWVLYEDVDARNDK